MSKTQQRHPRASNSPTKTAPNKRNRPPAQGTMQMPRWGLRVALFSALVVACAAVGIGYVLHANQRTADQERNAKKVPLAGSAALLAYSREPHILFRNTSLGDIYGRVAVVPRDNPSARRAVSELSCDRVDFAQGRGVCLSSDRGVFTTYHGTVFDERFRSIRQFDLAGAPSRVRVSPNGRWAGFTVFVSGHSYADAQFSTQTNIMDLRTGEMLPDFEQFTVRDKDGEVISAIDRNYWGVTFKPNADGFYATLQTGGHIYLIEGDISSRTANIIGDDVECPSLSPDGTRLAFKVRNGGAGINAVTWHLAVMDLGSGRRWDLPERRSVDDQVAWADDNTVVYGLPIGTTGGAETDLWRTNADGSGRPTRWLTRAWSPGVVSS